ncbi:hypothetical protein [Sporosalibacterium faouarense]|uniref:hypothetical protein n=1 Tax=Sporosalibacterium faouarense TaxID=516123 RepID=UPI00141C0B8A|nr:hypothetical protein [Sporosalibacterium faouarense]MTI49247.1 hypothetical protein [Bacillota bacterium]
MSQDSAKLLLISINMLMIWILFVPYIVYFIRKKIFNKKGNIEGITSLTIKLIPIIFIAGFMILTSALSIIPVVVENHEQLPDIYQNILSQEWITNYESIAITFNICLVLIELLVIFKFLSKNKKA